MLNSKHHRRSFLKILGLAPAGAHLAAKEVMDASVMKLSGMSVATAGSAGNDYLMDAPAKVSGPSLTPRHYEMALKIPSIRRKVEDIVRREVSVEQIDYDLASKRSYSLAAKVCFQRQRNVERRLESLTQSWSYNAIPDEISSWAKFAGIFLGDKP